jgi:UDP-D-galactose:(glucosyl)LPS alpha-1,6-D-galactosyltransferase
MIIDIVLGFASGRGGLESVLTMVTNELKKRGHKVRLFQRIPPPYKDWESTIPEIHYYDTDAWRNSRAYKGEFEIFRYALGYRKLVENLGTPDVVLATHTPFFSIVCKLALSYLAIDCPPILSWLHGPPSVYGGENFLKYCDAHLLIANYIGDKIRESIGNTAVAYYIGNPVNMKSISRIPRPTSTLKLIYIGRIDSDKGLDILLKALKKVNGDWRLKIIGDGPAREEILTTAKKLNLFSNIDWIGWRQEPWNEVDEASILILTSKSEGFGLVLVEALTRGVPVISTNCGGPSEIIRSGENGWLLPVEDHEGLAIIIQSIIDKSVALPSADTCEASSKKFTVNAVVDRMEAAILFTKIYNS